MADKTRDRTNEEWLADLRGPERDQAIADLRENLTRGLFFALVNRVPSNKLDALVDDFAQDALIRILDNLDTFRGESRFNTWAQKIAVRVAYTELRRQRWKDISLEDLLPEDVQGDFTPAILTDAGPTPEGQMIRTRMVELVNRLVMEELTERQRKAMLAIVYGGMPLEEVARRLDTNRNALYKLMHDARQRLQKRLAAEGLSPEEVLAAFDEQ
ncbi:MAG TPA: sigma-70 family RNA polymerase sigma factor [Anaerolineales bacterium]|nr:sigma-70 family RNA polymerase sigma factor [Anaerolineales bacterium]